MADEQETQPDPRIGKHGHYAPSVCAVTGQTVNGNHNSAVRLVGSYYFRVLNKVKPRADIGAVIKTLLPLVVKYEDATAEQLTEWVKRMGLKLPDAPTKQNLLKLLNSGNTESKVNEDKSA